MNKFFYLKHHDASTLYTTDRLSWRDLTGLAQGLLIYSNKPVMWQDLANLTPEKKFGSTPWTNYAFQCGFSAFLRNFCGVGCLSQGEGGAKEKIMKKKEKPTRRAPGVVIPSRRSRTLRTRLQVRQGGSYTKWPPMS